MLRFYYLDNNVIIDIDEYNNTYDGCQQLCTNFCSSIGFIVRDNYFCAGIYLTEHCCSLDVVECSTCTNNYWLI